jgi:hypothetical protein
MENHNHVPSKLGNFSLAFQQVCSMIAIGKTTTPDETLRELILQVMVLLPEEKFATEHQLAGLLNTLFGLQIAEHEVKYAIDGLTADISIRLSDAGSLVLQSNVQQELKSRIDYSYVLEEKVRAEWFEEIDKKYPRLPHPEIWKALRNYLAGAFLRHGIQAIALLDTSIELDHIYSKSLLELLRESVKDFPREIQLDARNAISNFMATVGQYPDRATYIAQLADGAFSYFSLSSEPNAANRLRENLSSLNLFLDTNFLFGILDLAIGPQVAVSNELIRVIGEYKFPFYLKRHPRTEREILSSVNNHETDFSQRQWSKRISRAAMTSRFLTGMELRYHQAFIETGIDVESFFRPFHHADILLNEKSIERFGDVNNDQITERVATLINDYTEYLGPRAKKKSYGMIAHDMTLLDFVRQLRSGAKSTLEAKALLITCDYNLYSFDWKTSKAQEAMPCTVLPNLFWQILRPFISSDDNFSKAFAETFAIPEFRTINSGSAQACSKMISILSGYKNFPEETAVRMLSNDILIDQLRKAESDMVFQKFVEDGIVAENEQLVGENMLLNKKYEMEQAEKIEAIERLEKTTVAAKENANELETEKSQRLKAEEVAKAEKNKRLEVEKKLNQTVSIGKAITLGVILIIVFETLVNLLPWTWLVAHDNSYGLQAAFDLLFLSISFLIFVTKWRKTVLIPLLISIGGIIIPLLGGPK